MTTKPQSRHQLAFEAYAALGSRRTYQAVAQQLGVSLSTVKSWAKAGHWNQKLAEREAQEARLLADRSLSDGTTDADRNLKIVQMTLMKLAKGILEGRVKGVISDVDRLIRLEEHLTGADTALCRDPKHAWARQTDTQDNSLEAIKERLLGMSLVICVRYPDIETLLLEELEYYRQHPDEAEDFRRRARGMRSLADDAWANGWRSSGSPGSARAGGTDLGGEGTEKYTSGAGPQGIC